MLTVFWQDDEGEHEVKASSLFCRIGRAPEADIRIANPSVSRRHAVLAETKGAWLLRDLGSQNGTTVAGRLVREHPIADGDVVRLGEIDLRFVVSVQDSIRLAKLVLPGPSPATREYRAGSTVLSASEVVHGKAAQSSGSLSRLNEEMTAELSRLADVAKSLIAATTLPALFERVLDVVLESAPVEHAYLLLHDPAAHQLVPKVGRSRDGKEANFAISQEIASHVFQRNESVLTLDAVDDRRFTGESILRQDIRSVMCAPLLTHDRTLGVVFAGSTGRRVALHDYHLHMLTVVASVAAVAIDQARLRQQVAEELLLRSRLTRYHSPTLVDQLLANSSGRGTMPPAERDVSVLFADIAGFTSRTENMAPSAVSRLLNSLFSELVEIVFAHEGTLDKFLGDGLMAIFGAPNDLPGHARRAVECAVAMQKRIAKLDVREGTKEPMRLRIGINSGMVVAGDIGSERRVEYTVLGNTVNLAARFEAFVAQPGDIIIGLPTQSAIAPHIETEPLGSQTLKGISESIPAFRVQY